MDRLVRLERPKPDDSLDGAGSGSWELVDEVWAEIVDLLPSRADGERIANGIDFAERPARVRLRFRTDITNAMRLVFDGRVMQIVSVPAELGRREGLELMVKDFSAAGNGA
jgi:head-tail adaptor